MRQIYEKLPSSEAVVVWNVRRGALAAVLDLVKTALAIQDLKNTLDTLPFAVVAEVMGIEVPGLSLEKVDDLKNMAYGAVAALQNPTRVLAAFGQKIGDTVEEEGIAYSISYVAADVAIQVLLSKGLGEVKNVSKADDLVDVARTVDTLNDTVKIADELTDVAKAVDQVGDTADAVKTVEKLDDVIESGLKTKPNQVHHFATNKSKKYTSQFESITKKYGLDLDDTWNKELMPHQGRHPYAYHDYVLDNMQKFDRIANGDKRKFLKLYNQMKQKIINNPEMLYKDYWKK